MHVRLYTYVTYPSSDEDEIKIGHRAPQITVSRQPVRARLARTGRGGADHADVQPISDRKWQTHPWYSPLVLTKLLNPRAKSLILTRALVGD